MVYFVSRTRQFGDEYIISLILSNSEHTSRRVGMCQSSSKTAATSLHSYSTSVGRFFAPLMFPLLLSRRRIGAVRRSRCFLTCFSRVLIVFLAAQVHQSLETKRDRRDGALYKWKSKLIRELLIEPIGGWVQGSRPHSGQTGNEWK